MNLYEALQRHYPSRVYPDVCTDGTQCYTAEIPVLPGCAAHGDTIEEALVMLDHARRAYIKARLEAGLAVPPPQPTPTTRWEASTFAIKTSDSSWEPVSPTP